MKISAAGSDLNIGVFHFTATTSGFFTNGRLYRTTGSTFSGAVQVGTFNFGTSIDIYSSQTISAGQSATFFLVGDFTTGSASLPSNFQVNLASNAVVQYYPSISTGANLPGVNFSLANINYTLTSANSAGNGITQGTLTPGQAGIVFFGFGVSTNASATVSGFNLYNTNSSSAAQAYFNNGKIYRSSSSTFSLATATQITSATVSFGYNSATGISISGLNESFTNGASPVYYFIVGDFNNGYYGTVPATSQFSLLTSQTNSIVQSSPLSANLPAGSNINGSNFSLALPTLTITGLNSATTNNITTVVNPGDVQQAFFGFKITVSGIITINNINVDFPAGSNGTYFANAKLYYSTDDVFSPTTDTQIGTVALNGGNVAITDVAQTITNTSRSYFLAMDVNTFNNSSSPSSVYFRFASGQGQPAFIQSSPYTTFNTYNVTGATLTMPPNSTFIWTGNANNTNFNNNSNWANYGYPTSTSNITIPGGRTYYPVLTANTSTGSITFSGINPKITINSGYTLSPGGGITVTANATPSILGPGAVSSASNIVTNAGSILTLSAPVTLTSTGAVTNAGTINVSSSALTVAGASTNSGTINHTGTAALTFSGTLDNTGTIAQSGGGTFTATGAFTNTGGTVTQSGAGNLNFGSTVNNSGTISQNSTGTITTTGTFTNSGTVTQAAGGNLNFAAVTNTGNILQSGSGTIAASGTVNNNSSGTITLGGGSNTFAALTNNTSGTVTLGSGDVTFSGTLNNKNVFNAGSGTIDLNANLTNTGTFTLSSGELDMGGGTFNNTNNGVFISGSGLVNFDRTNNQNINNNNSSTPVTFNKITFSNTGGSTKTKTLAGTGSGFILSSTGILTMSGKTTLAAGGILTLKSDADGSATIAEIPSTASITGDVKVERYISGDPANNNYRGYRMLSSPVYSGTVGLNNVYSLDYLRGVVYLSGTTGISGGFDGGVNPTIYLYRENLAPNGTSFISGNYRGVNNIINTPRYDIGVDNDGTKNIPVGNGYLFFFRGNTAAGSTLPASPATFTATGTLNQGTIKVRDWFTPDQDTLSYTTSTSNSAVRGYNLVGNPYASSIDWDKIYSLSTADSTVNISPVIYVYDALTKAYATYIAGHGGIGSHDSTANIIPSGQGFFVRANKQDSNSSGASLTFTESAKVSTQIPRANLLLSTSAPQPAEDLQYIRLRLKKDSVNNDGTVVFFKSNANPAYIKYEDALYLKGNSLVNISTLSSDNLSLAINQLSLPKKTTEIIPLNITITSSGLYQLNIPEFKNIPKLYDVWLMDAYKKDSLDIRANNTYNFNASTSDKASFGSNRFSLVIKQNPAYQLKLLDFSAAKITTGAQLSWITENESNSTDFTVQRSTDNGKTFEVVGSIASNDKGNYNIIDHDPVKGLNIYRLKQDDINGSISYSKPVSLMYADLSDNITVDNMKVYPNPVSTTVNVSIVPDAETASYTIKIVNGLGTLVKTATSTQPTWQDNVSDLLPGTYFVQVINNNTKHVVGNSKFVKL
ncbi:T9SS type A sorting domain-containing protein [Mucilaginibacter sp. SD-g]|uniref:T9SS type A sorting domain-containing protein n=1 Tax=Mucilaginibacter segetis TaxID=2793071 RepID=A0A934PVV1_9SPHI|nr:T9SS type A sorting domain-containing protein [Mucilaginibacter segetis]